VGADLGRVTDETRRTPAAVDRIRNGGTLVDTPTDEQLLADHVAGKPDTFELLVRRHADELFRFLTRFTGSATLAEDLLQEAFLQVHQSAAEFDCTRRFKPWLFTIAANKARDLLRSLRRRPTVPLNARVEASEAEGQTFLDFLSVVPEPPSAGLEREEQQELVRKVLSHMPEHLREVLVLSYFHRFPYKEIAEVLNIPLGTVKSRLHAAVRQFAAAYRQATEEQVQSDGSNA